MDSTQIQLESAVEKDFPEIIELENRVASKTYKPLGDSTELKKILNKGKLLKILKDGELAGILAYYKIEDGSVYIDALATDPKFRGKHLGREAMVQILQQIGNDTKIWLVTHPENSAVKLYESLGFKTESIKANYFGDGEPRAVMVLIRSR